MFGTRSYGIFKGQGARHLQKTSGVDRRIERPGSCLQETENQTANSLSTFYFKQGKTRGAPLYVKGTFERHNSVPMDSQVDGYTKNTPQCQ